MQTVEPMKRADSSEGSTVGFGSPVSAKLSWADLCDDSDDNEWEDARLTPEPRKERAPVVKDSAPRKDTANDGAWARSKQPSDRQGPAARASKRSGRAGQAQSQRGSPAAAWSNSHAKGARRSPTLAPQTPPPFFMMGFTMPPEGCNPMDTYSVVLEGMPVNLCNDVCLDAMLHQAGLQGAVLKCEIESTSGGGTASIALSHWQAALTCYNHFATSRWSSGSLQVTMQLPNGSKYNPGSATEQDAAGAVGEAPPSPPLGPARREGWPKSPNLGHQAAPQLQGAFNGFEDGCGEFGGFVCTPVAFAPDGSGTMFMACAVEGTYMDSGMVWPPRVPCA